MEVGDLNVVRKEISDINRKVSSLRRKKTGLEKELEDIAKEKKFAEKNFQMNYSKRSQLAKSEHVAKMLQPVEIRRDEINKELAELKSEYDEAIQMLESEDIMCKYSNEQEILTEVRSSADRLKDVVVGIVGERFYDELERQVQPEEIVAGTEELDALVRYFNVCEEKLERISKRSGKITAIINKIQGVIMSVNVEDKTPDVKTGTVVAVLLSVVLFFSFKFIYPFYVSMLCFGACFNLRRHRSIYEIMVLQKTVRDNVMAIENRLKEQAIDELKDKRETMKINYDNCAFKLDAELKQLDQESQRLTSTANSSFVFDDSEVRKDYELSLTQKNLRETSINGQISEIEKDLAKLNAQLKQKRTELDSNLNSLHGKYLNPDIIGTGYDFDNKFILDIKDGKIEYFVHPMASSVFLYNDPDDVDNFIRLIVFQLRTKLNPFAFNVDIYDPTTLGRSLIKFKPANENNSLAINNLFRILSNESQFVNVIGEYKEELNARSNNVLKEYSNIKEYNEYMLSIDSLAESYRFVFVVDPSMSVLGNVGLHQLFRVGGDVGIYYHVFIRDSVFYGLKDKASDIINSAEKFYIMDSGNLFIRARSWVAEKIKQVAQT